MATNVAILGATGVVGQKAIALLQNSHNFVIKELVASNQRIGMKYSEVVDWREPLMLLPEQVGEIKLKSADQLESPFVISCLPQDIALIVEPMLASAGKVVFSNASAFRMHDNVPLLVPEINSAHLSLLDKQETSGKIITNPNCSAVGITLALAPLMSLGRIKHLSVVTLQSISGAGYPGISSMDILGNTIPHIEGEADKITQEVKKILGEPSEPAKFPVTTHVHRVPVLYGHTATLHVMFEQPVNITSATTAYEDWNNRFKELFILHAKPERPQAIKDLLHDDQRIHIGSLKIGDQNNILGLVVLSNNIVRGAAGAALLNMEAYIRRI